MFYTHQEDSLIRRFRNVPHTSRRLIISSLEGSEMFHQQEEDSFFLENETIVDLCRTQEKVPKESAY
jgi:hypothetical protein